jgi:hypothetical protein
MDNDMKDSCMKVRELGKVKYFILMGIFMKDNGKITKKMVMESNYLQTDKDIKDNGNKINDRDRENFFIMMIY